ncbi:unnamed protein product [Caenorhabditis auriculariae]|uniref:Chromo domain-containing protein n=1 Tax=Caenorhabditis auriculariae TaxID=2777116 RepID=A0A8S1GQC3_9PELO|nr:unnamed protein product [Caenorhabditis auriculariae]
MSVHRRVILESEDEEEGSAESQEIATQEIATQESEEPEYEVEEIIKHRHNRKGVLEYFVKWRGFEHDDDSWVPVENMADGPLIRDYNEKHDVGKKKRSRSRSAYVNKSRGTRAVSRDLTRSPSPLSTRDLSPEETLPQAKNRRRALDPKASYFEKSRAPLIRLATGRPLTPQNSSKECTPEPEASESNVTTRNKKEKRYRITQKGGRYH